MLTHQVSMDVVSEGRTRCYWKVQEFKVQKFNRMASSAEASSTTLLVSRCPAPFGNQFVHQKRESRSRRLAVRLQKRWRFI